ncbi:TetR/AcrR family transcriptional regulator [Phyllobacterium phragmitis]|uniref:TetR/AcrR family transcriptional regulator n=1 Tax=Phyllobacterium phragmitis TaxID=2670329 RepID=A0ABQ0GZT5_9HYPH|nr:TetR/AcrR family transcriptional regulator [Mesorhizobium sp. RMAD-H1]MBB2970816.1 AcrR family transcriptional regulator [Mesorhizobium sp. RMAD-H1]
MHGKKLSSRERILLAATELAKEVGPAHLSLDAVAARAGLSKGGLLYRFPTKAKLLEAVVEEHLKEHDKALRAEEEIRKDSPNSTAEAFLEVFRSEYRHKEPPPSGVLAALAENPDFIRPIRRYNRQLLDRMQAQSSDHASALITFLTIEGMRSMQLLDCDILTDTERDVIMQRLAALLRDTGPDSANRGFLETPDNKVPVTAPGDRPSPIPPGFGKQSP